MMSRSSIERSYRAGHSSLNENHRSSGDAPTIAIKESKLDVEDTN